MDKAEKLKAARKKVRVFFAIWISHNNSVAIVLIFLCLFFNFGDVEFFLAQGISIFKTKAEARTWSRIVSIRKCY